MRFNVSMPVTNPPVTGFQPIGSLLKLTDSNKLAEAQRQAAGFGRERLIDGYRVAFANGRRVAAFVLSDELTTRGIPPAFWHSHQSNTSHSLNQKFDLLVSDLRWLRRWYPEHTKLIRYDRYRSLFTKWEPAFHRAAEYAFYQGKRPVWKIVGSLSLQERQQFDCRLLRAAPIAKRDAKTQALREQVFKTLQDDLRTVRRTTAFTDADAEKALMRRHALWICSRMTGGSPTEIAARYTQMTGQQITRQVTGKQVEKILEILNKKIA